MPLSLKVQMSYVGTNDLRSRCTQTLGDSLRPRLLTWVLTLHLLAPWVQMLFHIHLTHPSLVYNLDNPTLGLGCLPWALEAMFLGIIAGICSVL